MSESNKSGWLSEALILAGAIMMHSEHEMVRQTGFGALGLGLLAGFVRAIP